MELVLEEYVSDHLVKGLVPYYIYNIIVENHEVGRLVYRNGSDEECYFDGHIGYTIYEEYRGHHYAYHACLLLKDIIDKDYVYITCSKDNQASLKTIMKLDAEYIEEKEIPAKLKKFYHKDEYIKMIFKWRLK